MPPVVPFLLAVAFAWAALAKVVRLSAWRSALHGHRIPAGLVVPVLILVPVAELGTAGLLVLGGDATRAGAALAVAMVGAFSLAVLRARRLQGDRLPCGCFGGGGSRDYRLMLVRNALLGAVAAAVLLFPRVARFELEAPDASQVIPALLVALGVGLIAWLALTFARAGVRR